MARQLMTNQRGKSAPNLLVWQNADPAGNAYYCSPRTALLVQNGAGALVLTVQRPTGTIDGAALAAKTIAIAANELHLLQLDPGLYNQSDGTVYLDTSTQTGVKFAAIEVG